MRPTKSEARDAPHIAGPMEQRTLTPSILRLTGDGCKRGGASR